MYMQVYMPILFLNCYRNYIYMYLKAAKMSTER